MLPEQSFSSSALTRRVAFDAAQQEKIQFVCGRQRSGKSLTALLSLALVAGHSVACRETRGAHNTFVMVHRDGTADAQARFDASSTDVAADGEAALGRANVPASQLRPLSEWLLRSDMVDDSSIAHRVLYSWTTEEQVAQLRANPVLLTRWVSPTRGPSFADVYLQRLAREGDAVARLLRASEFRRTRYAWVSAWPTLRGWEGETYGNKLIKVTLRSDALLAIVRTNGPATRVIDMVGQPVDASATEVIRSRLAAVYFVHLAGAGSGSFADRLARPNDPNGAYRDFMLVNERMIEKWEVDSVDCIAEVQRSRNVARELTGLVGNFPGTDRLLPFSSQRSIRWINRRNPNRPVEMWEQYDVSLSMMSTRYAPTVENMTALSQALEQVRYETPLIHQVDPVRVPPPPLEIPVDAAPPTRGRQPARPSSTRSCQGSYCP